MQSSSGVGREDEWQGGRKGSKVHSALRMRSLETERHSNILKVEQALFSAMARGPQGSKVKECAMATDGYGTRERWVWHK